MKKKESPQFVRSESVRESSIFAGAVSEKRQTPRGSRNRSLSVVRAEAA